MKTRCVLAALLWMTGRILAVEEVPYAIANDPWTDGLGNHRAVVNVEQEADAVVARVPWRRCNRDPERKDILLLDAATGLRITDLARLREDRFERALAFAPRSVPGDYFVYYLAYPPQTGWEQLHARLLQAAGQSRCHVEGPGAGRDALHRVPNF